MLQIDPVSGRHDARSGVRFILYVEGARDREVLRGWAHRFLRPPVRRLFDGSVILGGRRPARALSHFRAAGGADAGLRGLVVLDRDGGGDDAGAGGEPGLEVFTWSRRHIESYLLVPDAIRRALRLPMDDRRVARILREHLPDAGDEAAFGALDAKKLLGPRGVLPRGLGRPVSAGRIARAMRDEELHPDVAALFALLRQGLGLDAGR